MGNIILALLKLIGLRAGPYRWPKSQHASYFAQLRELHKP